MERVIAVFPVVSPVSPASVVRSDFDLGVWFCGYEERSPWLKTSDFCPASVRQWLHVEVEEDRDAHYAASNLLDANDELLGGTIARRNWDGHWRSAWRRAIAVAFAIRKSPVRIFVDISSMPRAVYGPLLVEAARESLSFVEDLTFCYVPGDHRGDLSGHQQLDGLRTLAGLEGASRFDSDPALVLGLGYDGVLADTVVDLFQLDRVSCFYADPGVSSGASGRTIVENSMILSRAELVETAAVGDLEGWLHAIGRLVSWYSSSRDVMLLPLGPKTQVVASILFALANPSTAFRCLRTSKTKPIDVGVADGALPYFMNIRFRAATT